MAQGALLILPSLSVARNLLSGCPFSGRLQVLPLFRIGRLVLEWLPDVSRTSGCGPWKRLTLETRLAIATSGS